jgi:hypothetical protein
MWSKISSAKRLRGWRMEKRYQVEQLFRTLEQCWKLMFPPGHSLVHLLAHLNEGKLYSPESISNNNPLILIILYCEWLIIADRMIPEPPIRNQQNAMAGPQYITMLVHTSPIQNIDTARAHRNATHSCMTIHVDSRTRTGTRRLHNGRHWTTIET